MEGYHRGRIYFASSYNVYNFDVMHLVLVTFFLNHSISGYEMDFFTWHSVAVYVVIFIRINDII